MENEKEKENIAHTITVDKQSPAIFIKDSTPENPPKSSLISEETRNLFKLQILNYHIHFYSKKT